MIAQLTVQALQQRLATGERPTILDVREGWEYALCALPDSLHLPVALVSQQLDRLPRDGDIVVVCHVGVRSQMVAGLLRRNGFNRLYNLRGGIDAWAKEIDPHMAVY